MAWNKCGPEVENPKEMHTYIHFIFFNSYHRVMAWNKCGPEVGNPKEMHTYIHFIFSILTTG